MTDRTILTLCDDDARDLRHCVRAAMTDSAIPPEVGDRLLGMLKRAESIRLTLKPEPQS